jgi:[acyl-carrier-protein] S-malonyltransferase
MRKTAFLFPGQGVSGLYSQMEIFTISSSAYFARRLNCPEPSMVAGLSLGEFGALVAAQVLSHETAMGLIQKRQVLMKEACQKFPGSMLVILKADVKTVEEICRQVLEGIIVIANYNSPKQFVVSGETVALDKAAELAKEQGILTKQLNVEGGYHSPLMAEANRQFWEFIEGADFRPPQIPFYSGVTGDKIGDVKSLKAAMKCQMTSPVLFEAVIRSMLRDGLSDFIEIEPSGVLTKLVKQIIATH